MLFELKLFSFTLHLKFTKVYRLNKCLLFLCYYQVLRHLHEENRIFRIVGLSATPGTTVDRVVEVIENLKISKLEFRTDESLDVAKYMNKKDVECISVKLSYSILNIRNNFLVVSNIKMVV